MSEPLPLSVFIIALNEEDRIGRALESVRDLSDDIVVIDSGSTDRTAEIAQAYGARVIFNPWPGYGPQKRFGESQCKHDWVLNLDADESLSPRLQESIRKTIGGATPPRYAAYRCRWVLEPAYRAGSLIGPGRSFIRLYHRAYAGFKDSVVHDSVVIHPDAQCRSIGWLRGVVHHRTSRSLSHAVAKMNAYTTLQAQEMVRAGRVPAAWRLLAEPFGAFFKSFVFRRFFIYGLDGVIESVLYALGRFLRLAKARELAQVQKLEKKKAATSSQTNNARPEGYTEPKRHAG